MIALWLAAAVAAELRLAVVDGELHPGLPTRVELAVVDDVGAPPRRLPRLEAHGASLRVIGPVTDGVWAASLTPEPGAAEVRLAASWPPSPLQGGAAGGGLGGQAEASLPVRPIPPPLLSVPRRVDAVAGAGEVSFLVTGPALPPPEGLEVALGEGRLVGVEAVADGLRVTVATEDSPYPRAVPIGVLDATRGARPAWTTLRLRTRPRLALQTEPGSSLVLAVGGREYGPFEADAHGVVTAVVDQYPGELAASAVFTDDLGNETRTTLPLSTHTQPALAALVSGPIAPDGSPPRLFLRALHGDGHPWTGPPPTCRTATEGELSMVPVGEGEWVVALPDQRGRPPQELRPWCRVGAGVEVRPRARLADGAAARIRLRLWPEQVSADFPVAEVQVAIEDARGERMPVRGLEVGAELGSVEIEAEGELALIGEYLGRAAIPTGQDVIVATYRAPAGGPDVRRVEVRHGPVPREGSLIVHGRALDGSGRPVAGAPLQLDAGGAPTTATTGTGGWATAEVPLPAGAGPVAVQASSGGQRARRLALRRGPGLPGPEAPDLIARQVVPILAGRVAELALAVEPPVLYTGPGAVAFVTVDMRDRAGAPVAEVVPELAATEGSLGEVRRQPDGTWRVEYAPDPGDRAREVTLTARAEGMSASTRLLLEPRPLLRAPSVAIGGLTNLGRIASPLVALDVDWRVPLLGSSTMLRVGVMTYAGSAEVDTGFGEKLRLRLVVVPLQLSLLARRELGGRALWVGLGGVAAPYRSVARFGDEVASAGVGVLPPGLALTGGIGQRFASGEVMLELRGLALASPGGAVAFQGPVGGVGLVLGYRLIY